MLTSNEHQDSLLTARGRWTVTKCIAVSNGTSSLKAPGGVHPPGATGGLPASAFSVKGRCERTKRGCPIPQGWGLESVIRTLMGELLAHLAGEEIPPSGTGTAGCPAMKGGRIHP
jgi:hypothetical protein